MLLSNRWVQGAVISAMLLSIIDLSQRYNLNTKDSDDRVLETIDQSKVFSPFENEKVEKIFSNFQKYDQPLVVKSDKTKVVNAKPNPRLGKEFQDNQRGSLSTLFIGDYSYKPIGVFDYDSKFALLEQRHMKNKKTKRIKVVKGQAIGKYKVSTIQLNEINIEADDRKITLRLFDIKQKAKK
ncbi:hypothetical protein [Shewanella donghaensis]|uniref:hypothetical protein n=1 Tax=Shewanella donghaensis TaxID=238836 RepID=UPI0011828A6B|nr:hypothetical protein [Shewanella donghaensis]